MIAAQNFQSFTASVFPSQESEVLIAKQPVLADYGRELRSAINQLPPEVSRSLLSEYGEPGAELLTSIEDAVILREFSIERAAQEIDLDQEWLQGVSPRHYDEASVGAEDLWNAPEM